MTAQPAPEETTPESAEQVADLRALEAAAASTEPTPSAAQPAQATAAPAVDLASEFSGIASALLIVAVPMFPSLETIYTQETIDAAAGAVAAVCHKHGWLQGGFMGEYAEEMTAGMILLPLAIATNNAIKNDLAAKKKTSETPGKKQDILPDEESQSPSKGIVFGKVQPLPTDSEGGNAD